jgi:hypothetical protein
VKDGKVVTTAHIDERGTHVLLATVSDGSLATSASVTINVSA